MNESVETQHKPQGIIVDLAQRAVQFTWDDGHVSVFDLTFLRRACPCAECRPWIHDLVKTSGSHEPSDAVKNAVGELKSMQDVQPVGSYGLNFNWADGHTFGIYDWKYLRALDTELAASPETSL